VLVLQVKRIVRRERRKERRNFLEDRRKG